MDYEHLLLKQEGEALWVTLNRPERLNALNRRMVEELRHLFVDLYWRRDVRVVAITGAGDAFCAGLDLKESAESNTLRTVSEGLDSQRRIADIVVAMRRCPQPIVAWSTARPAAAGSPSPWRRTCGWRRPRRA